MSDEVVKDIGEIFARIFDHRPFLNGEINLFYREFEEERRDREIENLFQTLQNTIEVRDTNIERTRLASESHLPELQSCLSKTLALCERIQDSESRPSTADLTQKLERNRLNRKKIWQHFVDDMTHKCSRVDLTFEEKEEELREFYSDLERKLHIHK